MKTWLPRQTSWGRADRAAAGAGPAMPLPGRSARVALRYTPACVTNFVPRYASTASRPPSLP